VALVLATAFLVVGSAVGAATPISPAPDARTNSHPTFSWTLPADEQTDAIYISKSPLVTPQGEFYRENVEESDFFLSDIRTWAPTTALFAGPHWWNVRSRDSEYTESFSAPSRFTVNGEVRINRVRFNVYRFLRQINIEVRWTGNPREVVVGARFYRGRRQVGRTFTRTDSHTAMVEHSELLEWSPGRRVRPRTRLSILIQVTGAGRTASLRRSLRSP
jgi:hypothetical protein